MIRITAPQQSVVTELNVKNGDVVNNGDMLLSLSTELHSTAIGATQEEVVKGLKARRQSLRDEHEVTENLHVQEMAALEKRRENLTEDLALRERELELQGRRAEAATEALERLKPLVDTGNVLVQRIQELEQEQFDQLAQLQAMERDRIKARREFADLLAEIEAKPFQHRIKLAAIDREIASIEQSLAEAEARRQVVIVAPQAGTVTALQAELGGSVDSRFPLLSIIPRGSELEAELFLPSSARGFIRTGQDVLLRYQAFPFQKFGQYDGKISEIAPAAVPQSELAPGSPGISGATQLTEPIYLVKVKLALQNAIAYGEEIPLQPGMKLEANIKIETRKLYEWFLDPLFSMMGAQA
ncbi:Colicin V secretion protein CvaA [Defluviimonas aquaemixtae]|uniref:Colicin V secretion protein CvaA n=1 Tax=Albidovulum aquaemixtae TaxID=1542388 RepID=A0A2R8B3L0_9RHOB|nr:HlyD family efflux transporter periplasmic adaptor subunit [Defluviimonas aquaemixtae]SPH17251.1 Colicin V secretion protein CvaA [Defluviimonas aquaemixtae]